MAKLKEKIVLNKGDSDYFDVKALSKNISNTSTKSGIIMGVSQSINFIIRTISTMVLARTIDPEDFGIFGMVMIIANLLVMFKDFGLSMATIQCENINHKQVTNLFWVNVIIGLLLMLAGIGSGFILKWFYNKPVLLNISIFISSGILFSGLSIQHLSLLKRKMNFKAIAFIDVFSWLIASIIAIIAATNGLKYWALAIQNVSLTVCTFLGAWMFCGWRPGLPSKQSGTRHLFKFGLNVTGFNFMNYFIRNFDKILIGKMIGAYELGLYNKSYQFLLLPITQLITPITNVVVPSLSRLQQSKEEFKNYYIRVLKFIGLIIIPSMAFFSALSRDIILIFFGEKWINAVHIFFLFSIISIFQPFANSSGWIYMSLAKTDIMRKWAFICAPIYMTSYTIGIKWGIVGVGISYLISEFALKTILMFYGLKYISVKITDIFLSQIPAMIYGFIFFCISFITKDLFSMLSPIFTILICGTLSLITSIVVTIFSKSMKREVMFYIVYLKNLYEIKFV